MVPASSTATAAEVEFHGDMDNRFQACRELPNYFLSLLKKF